MLLIHNGFWHDAMKRNTALSLGTKIVEAVLYFVTDIVVANLLGKSFYGEWSFFWTVANIVFLAMGFGIKDAVRVRVARKQGNICEQSSYIWVGGRIRIVFSIMFCVILLALCQHGAEFLGFPLKYPELKNLFFLGIFLCFFNSFSEFLKAVCIGLNRFDYIFYFAVMEYGGYLVWGVGCLAFFDSIYALEVGYIVALVSVVALGGFFCNKYIKKNVQISRKHTREIGGQILKDVFPFLLTSCGTLFFAEIDTFMIGTMSNAENVAVYSIAKNLITKATHVNFAICTATMTTFACMNEANIVQKRKLFKKIGGINMLIAAGIVVGAFFVGPFAINILYGGEYKEAGSILQLLLVYFILYIIHLMLSMFLDYQGEIKIRSQFYFGAVILNVVLNAIFIPRLGAEGAAIATSLSMVPYVVFLVIRSMRIFRKYQFQKGEK